jgi:glycosyltransferase involved in cell wall biosynthesis
VGRGDISAVRRLAEGDPTVAVVGPVEDLTQEILQARICLAPIITGGGIRGKINQYAAAGRPTISTPLGASGLSYRDGESILIASQPGEFATAVVRLLTNEQLWRRLHEGCRQVLEEHHRWPAHLQRLEACYER